MAFAAHQAVCQPLAANPTGRQAAARDAPADRARTHATMRTTLALALLATPSTCALLLSSRAPRTAHVACCAAAPPAAEELKGEMLELLDEVENRGVGAPADVAEDILEIAIELDEARLCEEWDDSAALAGSWRLVYTSSRTFATNQGLSGYAKDIAGVETPELLMNIETRVKRVVYEEPVVLRENSMAAMFGKFAGADAVRVESVWRRTADNAMVVTTQLVVVGSQSWEPADRQDKAVRTLSAARPVFLDAELLVMRSQPDYVVWCFERA
jgi:hypothetical protein